MLDLTLKDALTHYGPLALGWVGFIWALRELRASERARASLVQTIGDQYAQVVRDNTAALTALAERIGVRS